MRNDFTYLAIILGLFISMFGLVRVCDRIIGSDEQAMEEQGSNEPDQVEAPVQGQVAA